MNSFEKRKMILMRVQLLPVVTLPAMNNWQTEALVAKTVKYCPNGKDKIQALHKRFYDINQREISFNWYSLRGVLRLKRHNLRRRSSTITGDDGMKLLHFHQNRSPAIESFVFLWAVQLQNVAIWLPPSHYFGIAVRREITCDELKWTNHKSLSSDSILWPSE